MGEGFEPPVGLTLRRFSKPVPSAARPSHRPGAGPDGPFAVQEANAAAPLALVGGDGLEDLARDVDRRAGLHRERDRVRRAAVHGALVVGGRLLAAWDQDQERVERAFAQLADDDAVQPVLEGLQDPADQVVGERPRRLDPARTSASPPSTTPWSPPAPSPPSPPSGRPPAPRAAGGSPRDTEPATDTRSSSAGPWRRDWAR